MSDGLVTAPQGRLDQAAVGVVLVLAALLLGAVRTEDALVRQIKIDVFDQNWTAVLKDCDELLEHYPASDSVSRATFYRARALAHISGREAEGLGAFRAFVARHPEETLLVDEAWSDIFRLACGDGGRSAGCAPTLSRGLENRSANVSTLAAIRAADLEDADLHRKALPVLQRAYDAQNDPDIRNEILIAILKIDPRKVPQGEGAGLTGDGEGRGGRKPPTLIRMTVFNKVEGKFDLKVNVPVAFARMLIGALGESQRRELRREAQRQGVDIDDIFETIQKSGAGRLLEVDLEESRIEIWIE